MRKYCIFYVKNHLKTYNSCSTLWKQTTTNNSAFANREYFFNSFITSLFLTCNILNLFLVYCIYNIYTVQNKIRAHILGLWLNKKCDTLLEY